MKQLEYVGVTHLDLHVPTRRDVLLFDRIALGGIDHEFAAMALPPKLFTDMQQLRAANVIFDPGVHFCHLCAEWQPLAALSLGGTVAGWALREPDHWIRNELKTGRDPNGRVADILQYLNAKGVTVDAVVKNAQQFLLAADHFSPGDVVGALRTIDVLTSQLSTRLKTHELSHQGSVATPLLPDVFNLLRPSQQVESRVTRPGEATVISVVLKQFPELDESVPWTDVLSLRAELQSQQHALHRWMRKVAQGEVEPTELRDEIEALLSEHVKYMDLQRAKRRMSRLEALLVVTGDVAENLIRGKFGTLARALIEFRNRDIAFAEAELTAPGREVAFIAEVNMRFQNKGA